MPSASRAVKGAGYSTDAWTAAGSVGASVGAAVDAVSALGAAVDGAWVLGAAAPLSGTLWAWAVGISPDWGGWLGACPSGAWVGGSGRTPVSRNTTVRNRAALPSKAPARRAAAFPRAGSSTSSQRAAPAARSPASSRWPVFGWCVFGYMKIPPMALYATGGIFRTLIFLCRDWLGAAPPGGGCHSGRRPPGPPGRSAPRA